MPFMMCFAGYGIREREVQEIQNPKFYLLRALRNQLIDTYKLKRNYSEVLTGEITDELPYKIKITVEDEIIAAEEQAEVSQKVDEILSILTERQREIIYLRYMQECSYEEIAEIMQISVPACRKLLYRTLLKLKHNNTLVLFYLLLSINVG
nr:RNA polymerase sigma factor [Bacteroides fragilis]